MLTVEYGAGKHKITLEILTTHGKGITILITGGDSPHVGAAALAVPSKNAATNEATCDINIITAYGHKDRFLAEKAADRICRKTGEIVSVTAGVHVDHASKADLQILMDNTMQATEMFLAEYCSLF